MLEEKNRAWGRGNEDHQEMTPGQRFEKQRNNGMSGEKCFKTDGTARTEALRQEPANLILAA